MEKSKKDRTERRRVGLLFDEKMCKHKQEGGDHIENPQRIRAIWENLNAAGLLPRCVVLNGKEANDNHLTLVHSKEHIHLIKTISSKPKKTMRKYANKYNSIYFNEGSSEAAYLAAGFVVEAAVKVAQGELNSAFAIVRPPGHHAEEAKPMGFCLLNNVAIAASVILNKRPELGIKKILIVDWDVHHGNSTQKMFYKDPRVLVFSVHRHDSGRFYPEGSDGSYKMMGEEPGAGYNINVPWEGGGVGDLDYFAVWDHILLPVAKEFDPDLIMISAGFDAATGDPIGGCCVSSYGYSVMLYQLMGFARGKIVMALEGGYNPVSLADATKACIEMLLDYKPSVRSLEGLPLNSTWPLIKKVRQALCIYWPILAAKIPDKVINSRLHIEVDVDIRQDEVYERTPMEREHASISGREDYFEDPKLPTNQSCPSSTMERRPTIYERVCAATAKKRKGASKTKVPREDVTVAERETSAGRKRPRENGLGDHSRDQTAVPQPWNLDLDAFVQRRPMDSLMAAQALVFQVATMLTQAMAERDAQVGEIRSLEARLRKEERDRQMFEEKVSTLIKERDDAVSKAELLLGIIDKYRRELKEAHEVSSAVVTEKMEMAKAHADLAEEVNKTKAELTMVKRELAKLKQSEADPSKDPKLFGVLVYYFAYTDVIRVLKRTKADSSPVEERLKDYAARNPLHKAFYLHILDLETDHGVDLSWFPDRSKLLMPGQAVPELDDDDLPAPAP